MAAAKHTRPKGKLIRLTIPERQMLLHALKIGGEDGSLYRQDVAVEITNEMINGLAEKLNVRKRRAKAVRAA